MAVGSTPDIQLIEVLLTELNEVQSDIILPRRTVVEQVSHSHQCSELVMEGGAVRLQYFGQLIGG